MSCHYKLGRADLPVQCRSAEIYTSVVAGAEAEAISEPLLLNPVLKLLQLGRGLEVKIMVCSFHLVLSILFKTNIQFYNSKFLLPLSFISFSHMTTFL
jgi:hypothetical protein